MPAGSEGSYPLAFAPPWMGTYAATLVLAIPATMESNTYALTGRGAEPAASDHVRLRCTARGSKAASVVVANTAPAAQEFRVFSDLPGICGPDKLLVAAASQTTYAFTYAPTLSGAFTGTLTFSSAAGQYVWFTIEATVAPAAKQDTISVSAPGARPCLKCTVASEATRSRISSGGVQGYANTPEPQRLRCPCSAQRRGDCGARRQPAGRAALPRCALRPRQPHRAAGARARRQRARRPRLLLCAPHRRRRHRRRDAVAPGRGRVLVRGAAQRRSGGRGAGAATHVCAGRERAARRALRQPARQSRDICGELRRGGQLCGGGAAAAPRARRSKGRCGDVHAASPWRCGGGDADADQHGARLLERAILLATA